MASAAGTSDTGLVYHLSRQRPTSPVQSRGLPWGVEPAASGHRMCQQKGLKVAKVLTASAKAAVDGLVPTATRPF